MIDIQIDISQAVTWFNINSKEIDDLRELVVKTAVNEGYNRAVQLANSKLNMSRNEYISALTITKENRFSYTLSLNGSKIANMIEMGSPSFDLKKGFAASSKAKQKKDGGWYLIIPFKFRTTAANPTSGNAGQLLPRRIYDLIRNNPDITRQVSPTTVISSLKGSSIPERYQPKQSVIGELNNTADQYIPKSSIYAGLQRTQNIESGKSAYNTFRVVSDKSPSNSWIHPGIQAFNLLEESFNSIDTQEIVNASAGLLFGDNY